MTPQVWGVTMVRDEADVIEQTLQHLADQELGGVIVFDNRSTDGTSELLADLAQDWDGWLKVVDDPEPGYWQSSKMTAAARMAADLGADWVIPFDADELWTHPEGLPLGVAVPMLGDSAGIVRAVLHDYRCTAADALPPPSTPEEAQTDDPFTRMVWREVKDGYLPKVAVRTDGLFSIHPGNHGADHKLRRVAEGALAIAHYPYRSPLQMVSKGRNGAEAYSHTTLPRTYGQHWREYGEIIERHGEAALAAVFWDHFFIPDPATYDDPDRGPLVRDPGPVAE